MGKQSKKSFLKNNKVKKTNIHNSNSNASKRKKIFYSHIKDELEKNELNNLNDQQNNQINNNNNNNNHNNEEEIGEYIGERNELNEKHGKGKLILEDGNVILSGQWINDEIIGDGKYKTKELILKGKFINGTLNGIVKEFDRESKRLIFEGYYKEGVRNGKGTLFMDDGGSLRGSWNNGSLNGHGIYKFKDERFTIEGQWYNSQLIKGKYRMVLNENNESDKELNEYYKQLSKKIKEFPIKYDISTDTIISNDPMIPDIYENYYCYVKDSTIPNSGEGLFARVDIPENTTVSFYNGIRIPHSVVNERSWDLNGNTISLDNEIVIDVPQQFINTTTQYCASISHKANHSHDKKNAEYSIYNHPRFGEIKSIKSTKPIKKDDEIFVTYDYTDEKPIWYK